MLISCPWGSDSPKIIPFLGLASVSLPGDSSTTEVTHDHISLSHIPSLLVIRQVLIEHLLCVITMDTAVSKTDAALRGHRLVPKGTSEHPEAPAHVWRSPVSGWGFGFDRQ